MGIEQPPTDGIVMKDGSFLANGFLKSMRDAVQASMGNMGKEKFDMIIRGYNCFYDHTRYVNQCRRPSPEAEAEYKRVCDELAAKTTEHARLVGVDGRLNLAQSTLDRINADLKDCELSLKIWQARANRKAHLITLLRKQADEVYDILDMIVVRAAQHELELLDGINLAHYNGQEAGFDMECGCAKEDDSDDD